MIKKIFIYTMLICGLLANNIQNNAFAMDIYAPYTPQNNEVIFNQSSYRIDVIDPKTSTNIKGINYPGLRGANQLVIYTPEFGYRTNTNEFGTEAIITGDTVTSLSGADSLIPANGIVVSGHGNAKKWINENIILGAKISIDTQNMTITSYITSDTFLYSAKERVKEVQDMMVYYMRNKNAYNQRRAEQNLNRAKDNINKALKNSDDSQKYATKAMEYADNAMSAVIPYEQNELKGVWIRPTYYTPNDIISVLNKLEASGVNNLFIETYYHGKTIFPSKTMEKYGFISQNEEYVGFDPLRIWINEAHKRGIKVHIWFESFYVGNKAPESNPKNILAIKPQWANRQKKTADAEYIPYSVSEHNGYFIDPANPEVQNFLYSLISEIITTYRPDGINLDYIRYPQSLAYSYSNYDQSNWGYTEYARSEFKSIYGVDPIELTKESEMWDFWRIYRCNKVTNFVRKIGHLCRVHNIAVTAVIFPNRTGAMETKMQDWKNWSMNNFIDGFTPLFLTCDDKTAQNLMEEVLRNKSASTKLYAGLFVTFMNGSSTDLLKQIHVARKNCLNGLIVFDYAHFGDKYINVLTESVFKPTIRVKEDNRRERR